MRKRSESLSRRTAWCINLLGVVLCLMMLLLLLLVNGLHLGLLRILGYLGQGTIQYRWLVLGIELAALAQCRALVDLVAIID